MEKLSVWLGNKILKNGYINKNQLKEIVFALQVILSNSFSFGSIIFLALILDYKIQLLFFLVIFIGLRSVQDGYHADTFIKCYFMTVSSFLIPLFLSNIIVFNYSYIFAFIIMGILFLFLTLHLKYDVINNSFLLLFLSIIFILLWLNLLLKPSIVMFCLVTLFIVLLSYLVSN